MNFPWTIPIGGAAVSAHAVCEAAGVFVAYRYYKWLQKKKGDTIEENNRLVVVIGAAFGAVLGARLLGAAEDIPAWRAATSGWGYFLANKTLVGGLLGGLLGVELLKRLIGEKRNTGDLFVFPLLLGMIIGRVGCFSAGVYEQAYGLPTALPWGMDLGDGIKRHPVTLYEIGYLLLLWLVLQTVQKKYTLQEGALFKLMLMAYLVFRLLLDVIKPGWRYALGLGSIQLACIGGLLYYYKYLLHPRTLLKH